MPISESQFETWSHQGSIQQSSSTYQTVRAALLDANANYVGKDFEVFLQGSYGNDTNIYAESDVDAVIRLDSIMNSDLSALPPEQQQAYHNAYSNATYTFAEFKAGVVTRLTNAFEAANVTSGNKAIRIKANGSRRSADVVACYQHRRYIRFISTSDYEFVPGVIFPTSSSGTIINYPKRHASNCTVKHQATNSWFKPIVRIFKNMRSTLVAQGTIAKDTAPSYYVEGMIWNVPNDQFGSSYVETFCNCVNWLLQTDRSKLQCANEQYPLLGQSNVQWTLPNYDKFVNALVQLWKDS
ncbi:MAG: nucleotidyltransferase [Verrucomicrobiota bacterium]